MSRTIALGNALTVSMDDLWSRLVARIESGPFGDSASILQRSRAVEEVSALLAGVDEPGQLAPGSRAHLWWRLGVAQWRNFGELAQLTAFMRSERRDVLGRSRPASESAPWLWNATQVEPAFADAFTNAVEREFALDASEGWQGQLIDVDGDHGPASQTAMAWSSLDRHAPQLLGALREHVSAIAWIRLRTADTTFRSGTTPAIPGVIFASIDEAEDERFIKSALVHEAAHCKFFDLCLARDVVATTAAAEDTVPFRLTIPWVEPTAVRPNRWPLDQSLAAAHSYLHLVLLAAVDPGFASVESNLQRLEFLTSQLRHAPTSAFGAEGICFVRWMRELTSLARLLTTVTEDKWGETGPVVSLPADVQTYTRQTWHGALAGLRGGPDVQWLTDDGFALATSASGRTIGEVVAGQIGDGPASPAEILIQVLAPLSSMAKAGLLTLENPPRDRAKGAK